jgi:hypothetical protein
MIKFGQHLNEIFDQPYEFEKTNIRRRGVPKPHELKHGKHFYKFSSPNDQYRVSIRNNHHGEGTADVEFLSDKGFLGKSKAEASNAHRIFSTVHHIIKHHMNEHPDQSAIQFSATKPSEGGDGSRVKLYRHLVNKFAHKHKEFDQYGDNTESAFHVKRQDIKENLNEQIRGRTIGTALEWNGQVVVYDHSDGIMFMLPGKLVSFTSFRVTIKLDKTLLVYDNLGQIVSSIPSP